MQGVYFNVFSSLISADQSNLMESFEHASYDKSQGQVGCFVNNEHRDHVVWTVYKCKVDSFKCGLYIYIAYRQVDLNSDTKTITHSKFKLRGVFLLVSLNSKLLQFLDNSIWIWWNIYWPISMFSVLIKDDMCDILHIFSPA